MREKKKKVKFLKLVFEIMEWDRTPALFFRVLRASLESLGSGIGLALFFE